MTRFDPAVAYATLAPMAIRRRLDRTPDTVTVLALTTLSGASVLLTRTPPAAMDALAPTWLGLAWGLAMTASSACALVGAFWPEELTGWGLELAGRITLAVTLGLYGVAIALYITSPGAAISLGLAVAFAASSGWRAFLLARRLRAWRVFLRASIARDTPDPS